MILPSKTPTRRAFLSGALSAAALASTPLPLFAGRGASESLEQKLAADPRRPQFHLLPAANWMNDPNAPIYWKGKYHMFYQYNPNGAFWGDMHWAHAVSPDMVHWKHLPVALAPTPGGPDAAGCFTGSAIADGAKVAVLYTGIVNSGEDKATIKDGAHKYRETQCLAYAEDAQLNRWHKVEQPVLSSPPPGLKITGFRDPSVWKEGEWWYMTVGSGIEKVGGAVLLYRSKNLRQWEYMHILASGTWNGKSGANPVGTGEMWECPELFPLNGKHVLIFSTEGKVFWQSGTLDAGTKLFYAENVGLLDHGSYYAPKTQLDAKGQRILWGWIQEARPEAEYRAAGWAGMMSLPRVLALDEHGRLRMQVSPAVQTLRSKGMQWARTPGSGKSDVTKSKFQIRAACGEILCLARRNSNAFEMTLESSLNNEAILSVIYTPGANEVAVDGKKLPIEPSDQLELHAYIDGSVIELMINRQAAYTKRFYYEGSQAPEIRIQITDATALQHIVAWQISPISTNRLTTAATQV